MEVTPWTRHIENWHSKIDRNATNSTETLGLQDSQLRRSMSKVDDVVGERWTEKRGFPRCLRLMLKAPLANLAGLRLSPASGTEFRLNSPWEQNLTMTSLSKAIQHTTTQMFQTVRMQSTAVHSCQSCMCFNLCWSFFIFSLEFSGSLSNNRLHS